MVLLNLNSLILYFYVRTQLFTLSMSLKQMTTEFTKKNAPMNCTDNDEHLYVFKYFGEPMTLLLPPHGYQYIVRI